MSDSPAQNPYGRDGARKESRARPARSNRPVGLMIAAALQAWTAVYMAWSAKDSVKEIRAGLEARGYELPGKIHVLFAIPWPWWLFAALAVVQLVCILSYATDEPTPVQVRRMKASLWIFGVAFGAVFGWATYEVFALVFGIEAAGG